MDTILFALFSNPNGGTGFHWLTRNDVIQIVDAAGEAFDSGRALSQDKINKYSKLMRDQQWDWQKSKEFPLVINVPPGKIDHIEVMDGKHRIVAFLQSQMENFNTYITITRNP